MLENHKNSRLFYKLRMIFSNLREWCDIYGVTIAHVDMKWYINMGSSLIYLGSTYLGLLN